MNLEQQILDLIREMRNPRNDGWMQEGIRLDLINLQRLIEGALNNVDIQN